MRENTLRTLFAQHQLAINGWASIGNAFAAKLIADCGGRKTCSGSACCVTDRKPLASLFLAGFPDS